MIFVVDIGNTNIAVGAFEHERICFTGRLSTDRKKTDLEYAIDLKNILEIFHVDRSEIDGCIISSVVPQITNVVRDSCGQVFEKTPIILGPGLRTGLNIMLDNPAEMGADRVADAVAASNLYPLPVAIVDMGTATTISVVDAEKRFIGGAIYPGVRISLDALTERASQLGGISLDKPKNVIGRNTIECMRSGILYGSASVVDGIVDRFEEALGQPLTVVATGGMSGTVIPFCRRKIIIDEFLLLKGLRIIYEKNDLQ